VCTDPAGGNYNITYKISCSQSKEMNNTRTTILDSYVPGFT
jgi:hypothetical protein